ncbi:MAG TPA: hypothetical protein VGL63_08465 [Streptosporangiaceae bacterium]
MAGSQSAIRKKAKEAKKAKKAKKSSAEAPPRVGQRRITPRAPFPVQARRHDDDLVGLCQLPHLQQPFGHRLRPAEANSRQHPSPCLLARLRTGTVAVVEAGAGYGKSPATRKDHFAERFQGS